MSPTRIPLRWCTEVAEALDRRSEGVPLYQVDAHNVVPVWVASDKMEKMARWFRPRVERHFPQYLVDFPPLPANAKGIALTDKVRVAPVKHDCSTATFSLKDTTYGAGTGLLLGSFLF